MTNAPEPHHFESFSSTPILDGHIHACPNCDPALTWEALHASGANRCNALSLSRPDQPGTLNQYVFRFKRASKGMAYGFGALDYSAYCQGEVIHPQDFVNQVIEMRDQGLDGVKMWEMKPLVYINLPDHLDGPLYEDYFYWLEENSFPVVLHIADAPRFWDPTRKGLDPWSFAGEEYPSRQAMYDEIGRVLDKHPSLRLILAHFAFLWDELPQAAQFFERYPSVCFDLTPGVEGYVQLSRNVQAAREFFVQYQERIIYGTDTGAVPLLNPQTTLDPKAEISQPWLVRAFLETDWDIPFPSNIGVVKDAFAGNRLRGINLPDQALRKIYGSNFLRMAGGSPRPL